MIPARLQPVLDEVRPVAEALVVEMGAEPIIVAESDRAAYAEAIEIASGFSGAIVGQALARLAEAGVENPAAMIGPVIRTSVETALAAAARLGSD